MSENETKTKKKTVTNLPVLPLKSTVIFPLQGMPLVVGRPQSIAAVHTALSTEDKTMVLLAQKNPDTETPTLDDVYHVGTKAVIKRMVPADGMLQIIVQGIERVRISPADPSAPRPQVMLDDEQTAVSPLMVQAALIERPSDWDTETEALHREVLDIAHEILNNINPEAQGALQAMIDQVDVPLHQVYLLTALISLDTAKEQQLLEANSLKEALNHAHEHISHEFNVMQLRQKIADKTQTEMGKEQREYMLRKQLAAIQAELGEQSAEQADIQELRRQIEEANLPEDIQDDVGRELQRLERLPTASPDYQMTRSYMELVAELPWNDITQDNLDLKNARTVLDADHHGLEKIKERASKQL